MPDVDVSYWTLGVELKFYAVMLGLFVVGWLRRIDVVLGVWLAAILGFWFSINVLGLPIPHALGTPLNVSFGHLFIAGIVFYQLKTAGSTFYRHAILACCLATQAVLGSIESTVVVAMIFAIFYAFTYNRLGWIASRPLIFLGAISYSLYLFHEPIGNIVILGLRHFNIASPTLLMTIAFAVALLVSTTTTYLVERPAISLIRGWYKARKAQRLPAAKLAMEEGQA